MDPAPPARPNSVGHRHFEITGQAEWHPVAFFLRDENGEVLGGLLGDIWAAWLHVKTLAVVVPYFMIDSVLAKLEDHSNHVRIWDTNFGHHRLQAIGVPGHA